MLACGEQPTGPPGTGKPGTGRDKLALFLAVSPSTMPPGDTAIVTCTAEPPSGVALQEWSLRLGGMIDTTLQLPVTGDAGSQTLQFYIWIQRVKVQGQFFFTLRGIAEPDTVAVYDTLTIDDKLPPTFRELWAAPNVVPGDSLQIEAWAYDRGGMAAFTVDLSGAMEGHDSVGVAHERNVHARLHFGIPRTANLGDDVIATWHAIDLFGNQTETTQVIPLEDNLGPWAELQLDSATALVDTSRYLPAVALGDTAYMTLTAGDNYGLRYFGTVISGHRDSVILPTDTLFKHTFTFTLPPYVPDTGFARLSYFVWDSVGHLLEKSSTLEFFNGIRHPLERLTDMSVNVGDPLLHDPKRNRMYHFSSPAHFIAYDVPGSGIAYTLPLPEQHGDMDLTASGDSVVISDINFGLYVVDLTEATPRLQPLEIPDLPVFMPWSMVIDNTNRMLLSGWPLLEETGYHQQIDITTRTRTRLDLGFEHVATLTRSAERRLMVAHSQDTVVTYDLDAQQVLSLVKAPIETRFGAMDRTGSLIILLHSSEGGALYDNRLSLINPLPMLEWYDSKFGLSLDGGTLFSSPGDRREMYIRSMPGGQSLKRILTPSTPKAFVMLEDGRVLVAMDGLYEIRNW